MHVPIRHLFGRFDNCSMSQAEEREKVIKEHSTQAVAAAAAAATAQASLTEALVAEKGMREAAEQRLVSLQSDYTQLEVRLRE